MKIDRRSEDWFVRGTVDRALSAAVHKVKEPRTRGPFSAVFGSVETGGRHYVQPCQKKEAMHLRRG
jgi:hypothetical protein